MQISTKEKTSLGIPLSRIITVNILQLLTLQKPKITPCVFSETTLYIRSVIFIWYVVTLHIYSVMPAGYRVVTGVRSRSSLSQRRVGGS